MSLKEEIERRRAAQTAGANITNTSSGNGSAVSEKHEALEEPPPFLRLVKRDKQSWLLPWACFHGAGYEPDAADGNVTDKCEHIHLVFMNHDISVHGHNLGGVLDEIEAMALRELCESSEKYHTAIKAGGTPVVLAMEIKVKTQ